ncbi:MAG: response regulator [Promethearchaeota archaeon]
MRKYENETGKKAIWRGRITDSFRKWQKGEKIYEKDKERIMLLVSEDIKSKWQDFVKKSEYSTISKLIRDAVNFFIDLKEKRTSVKTVSQLSHDLKEPLTIIKGYSHLLFENYKEKLDWDIILKIKSIYDQSLTLENKIISNLEDYKNKDIDYDVLIIEDDLFTINLLVDFFEMKGHSCKFVMTGMEALEELQKFIPKLILIDVLLPDIDGYKVCKEIKSNENLKNVPTYYATAVPRSEVLERLEETGADGYFLKPFDFTKFEELFNYL